MPSRTSDVDPKRDLEGGGEPEAGAPENLPDPPPEEDALPLGEVPVAVERDEGWGAVREEGKDAWAEELPPQREEGAWAPDPPPQRDDAWAEELPPQKGEDAWAEELPPAEVSAAQSPASGGGDAWAEELPRHSGGEAWAEELPPSDADDAWAGQLPTPLPRFRRESAEEGERDDAPTEGAAQTRGDALGSGASGGSAEPGAGRPRTGSTPPPPLPPDAAAGAGAAPGRAGTVPPPPIAVQARMGASNISFPAPAPPEEEGGDESDSGDEEAIDLDLGDELVEVVEAGHAERAGEEARSRPAPGPGELESPTAAERAAEEVASIDWEARAEALSSAIEEAEDSERVAALAYELGELAEAQLSDEARAVRAYGRALQADPSLRANLWAIRRVFYRRGLWPNLLKLIGAELGFARSDEERADLHIERGRVHEGQLGDREEAKSAYDQALALAPHSLVALIGRERIALVEGDEATLETLWRDLANASPTPARKLGYLLDLARLASRRGDFASAESALREAGELGIAGERVARERELLAFAQGDTAAEAEALEEQAGALLARYGTSPPQHAGEPGGSLSAEELPRLRAVALRRRQARRYRDSGEPERAWDALERALALAPAEPLLLADMTELAEELGRFAELAELTENWETIEGDPERSLGLSLRRAGALARSGRSDEARALLESLASSAPGYLPVVAARERLALSAGDARELATLYEALADGAQRGVLFGASAPAEPNPGFAAVAYTAAAEAHASILGEPDAATDRYRRALAALPGYPAASEALAELLAAAGELGEAGALLEGAAEPGEPAASELLELAADMFERAGRWEDAARILARLVEAEPEGTAQRFRLADALAGAGAWARRAEELTQIAERTGDPSARAELLARAAGEVESALGDRERAAELLRRAVAEAPEDPVAKSALADLLRRAGRFEDLVAARRNEGADSPDPRSAAEALWEAAVVARELLGRPGEAAAILRELVERRPEDARARRALLAALEEAGDREELETFLEREAEIAEEAQERADAWLRLGRCRSRAGDHEAAAARFRAAAEADPEATTPVVALLGAAARRGDPHALCEALELLAERVGDPEFRAEARTHAAWLRTCEGDADAAEARFEEAAESGTSAAGPRLGAALAAAARGADPADLGDALEALAGTLGGGPAAAAFALRAAALAEGQGDSELAQARAAQAARASSGEPAQVVAAAEIAPASPAAGDAPEAWSERAELFARRAALARDEARGDWELDRAEALEAAGRLREAGNLVASILRERPEDIRALQALRRLCERGGDRAGLGRATAALARVLRDPGTRIELLREAAAIVHGELGADEDAASIYWAILEEDPSAPEYETLHAIFVEHDDVRGLLDLVSRHLADLEALQSPASVRAPLLLERASLRERVDDLAGASADVAALLEIDSAHAEALRTQADLLARLGAPRPAAEHYARYLEHESDSARRLSACVALVQLLTRSGDSVGALRYADEVARADVRDPESWAALADAFERAGDWERAADAAERLASLHPDPAEGARQELRASHIARNYLGDAERASAADERAYRLDPSLFGAPGEAAEPAPGPDPSLFGAASEPAAEPDPSRLGAHREPAVLGARGAGDGRREAPGDEDEILGALAEDPSRAALFADLAALASQRNDEDTRYLALSARVALGEASPDEAEEVRELAAGTALEGSIAEGDLESLIPAAGAGVSLELWRAIAPAAAKMVVREPGQLGFERGDRIPARALQKRYPQLAGAASALGASSLDAFVAESRPGYARAVDSGKPTIFAGGDVARAESPQARAALGRELFHLRAETTALAGLGREDLALVFAASAKMAEIPAPPAVEALARQQVRLVSDRERELAKQLGRTGKKALSSLAARLRIADPKERELVDPETWRRGIEIASARAALLLAGDAAAAIRAVDDEHPSGELSDLARDILGFAVGRTHRALRGRLWTRKSKGR